MWSGMKYKFSTTVVNKDFLSTSVGATYFLLSCRDLLCSSNYKRMSTAAGEGATKVNNPFVDAARSVTASGSSSMVYEGERAVHEYLQFHYGRSQDVMPFDCGPTQALGFAKRCADLCADAIGVHGDQTGQANGSDEGKESSSTGTSSNHPLILRAIDVGCAVGGITFELTRTFDEVIGVDCSASFVQAARQMREDHKMAYQCLEQGSIVLRREAVLPEGTIPSRARFEQGDACALDVQTLGSFDVVLASNLLCRLPSPRAFLSDLPALVKPGGVAVLISPYSWLAEYTPPSEWLGGFHGDNGEGEVVDSFDRIRAIMEAEGRFKLEKRLSMPFLIREHARKFQWGCSDGTVWRRQ